MDDAALARTGLPRSRTTKFNNSITRGFAAVGEPHVAVCLLPGTEIAFDENVECEPSFGLGILPNKKIGQRLARFRQINMDNAVTHHDALEFPDGHVVARSERETNLHG